MSSTNQLGTIAPPTGSAPTATTLSGPKSMPDPTLVLAALCLITAAFGLGFTAGRNQERRQERLRTALRDRYR